MGVTVDNRLRPSVPQFLEFLGMSDAEFGNLGKLVAQAITVIVESVLEHH